MRLHAYCRSSTSYRVRIGLNLKGLDYDIAPVDLLKDEQRDEGYLALNPYAGVPALEVDGRVYAQSMPILEWLDERFPAPPFLPGDADQRFAVRELAYAIATELHAPLNSPVLKYLREDLNQDEDGVRRWYHHWLGKTLTGVERRLAELGVGDFLGAAPGLFECVLIPQLHNARRFGFDLSAMPWMHRIESACLELPEFIKAHPDNQPDAR